ncbi:MAG: GGDEF/EAL domain-containing response regulator [Thiobacillaceae bacterium]
MINWGEKGKPGDRAMDDERVRILIIEDDTRFAQSMASLLCNAGWSAETCLTGTAGLGRMATQPYDVVLVDINLPDMSGHEVVRVMRDRGEQLPVIVVSGETQIDAAVEALRLGAADFVRKPIEPDFLLHRIRAVLKQRWLEREYKSFQHLVSQSERLHRFLVDNSPDIIFTLDDDNRITFINDRVQEALGIARQDLLGKSLVDLVYADDRERARYVLKERQSGNQPPQFVELRLTSTQDSKGYRVYQIFFSSIPESNCSAHNPPEPWESEGSCCYGVARDITEQREAKEWATYHFNHDALTGLPNRQLFRDRLGLAITQAQRNRERFAVVYLNMDRFSAINDLYGHARADEVLRQIAERIQRCLRGGDTLARLAADEFLLLNHPIRGAEDVLAVLDRITQELAAPFKIDDTPLKLTASAGVALYPEHGDNPESLIRHANIALYHGRRTGHGSHAFFQEAMRADADQRLYIEHQLQRAIEQTQFELHFQPQVDIGNRRIRGVEALVRWNHPERGLLAPNEFIGIAEETGLIVPLSRWVLDESCRLLRHWIDLGIAPPRIGINLSPRCLEMPTFVERFMSALDRYGVPPERIEVEITENLFIHDPASVVPKLKELATRGVRIAIDDFGTQYSSLGYLQKFPIHTLKIDKSFVWEIDRDASQHTIIKAIISIGQGLGLNLIAEGVETEAQLRFLREQGCSEIQGFLISRPLPGRTLEQWLARGAHPPTLNA